MARSTLKWDVVPSQIPILRTSIPGGWLICTLPLAKDGVTVEHTKPGTITFVPDKNHEWDGTNSLVPVNHRHYGFDKELAEKFGIASNAFRHRYHAINSLSKLMRENSNMDVYELSELWYSKVLERLHGFENDEIRQYTKHSFVKSDSR